MLHIRHHRLNGWFDHQRYQMEYRSEAIDRLHNMINSAANKTDGQDIERENAWKKIQPETPSDDQKPKHAEANHGPLRPHHPDGASLSMTPKVRWRCMCFVIEGPRTYIYMGRDNVIPARRRRFKICIVMQVCTLVTA